MIRICSILALALTLGACAHGKRLDGTSKKVVCEAMVGPIHYNSKNRKSAFYAGPRLAPQLRVRNRVGINLGCPEY